ncbi:hypothetical protein BTO30_08990 [Domibacillus antri]|uniref:AB hydrolase-1 domain-containing protein n=1 Tax=Domibacillus antri TaxID=1714264 RepID=A0A1Q8Q517_9BACI|nr:alpha/beta fold hydrolase [Domibacillus antri]OLN22439.1 hypothetical protein BTO30_08990 [Domibacillus antri]
MAAYVLIHGAWHGAWCWEKVVPLLEQEGHTVHTADLPSHGSDPTPISQVSLKRYTDKVCAVIDEAEEPVILVGHSMGGIAISQSAEYRSEKIKSLVYVTAFLLRDNESMVDVIQTDHEALVARNMNVNEEAGFAAMNEENLRDVFYGCCADQDIAKAKTLLTPQALNVLSTKLNLTKDHFGKIPKYYIECLRDQAITHWCQKKMYTAAPCEEIFTLDTDHSPFYSTPEELVSILLKIDQHHPAVEEMIL